MPAKPKTVHIRHAKVETVHPLQPLTSILRGLGFF